MDFSGEHSGASTFSFNKLFDLSGRVALVTGAGAGLGEAISLGFAEYGCDVACADINLEAALDTSARVAAKGRHSVAQEFDLGQPEQIERMVDATLNTLGPLDILVNCGGVIQHDPSESLPLETWNRVVDVNLRGTFLCCQLAGRSMLERRKGCIVNISSISGAVGFPRGVAAYSASKGGIDALTRQLAIEWAMRGIRVNSVAPCQFWTPGLQRAVRGSALDPDTIMDAWKANIPLGRLGRAEEVVGPVLFLVSDAACMVTGTTLHVDGGYLAR